MMGFLFKKNWKFLVKLWQQKPCGLRAASMVVTQKWSPVAWITGSLRKKRVDQYNRQIIKIQAIWSSGPDTLRWDAKIYSPLRQFYEGQKRLIWADLQVRNHRTNPALRKYVPRHWTWQADESSDTARDRLHVAIGQVDLELCPTPAHTLVVLPTGSSLQPCGLVLIGAAGPLAPISHLQCMG